MLIYFLVNTVVHLITNSSVYCECRFDRYFVSSADQPIARVSEYLASMPRSLYFRNDTKRPVANIDVNYQKRGFRSV
jgi:hypothetical protein